MIITRLLIGSVLLLSVCLPPLVFAEDPYNSIPLNRQISHVQPMTGITFYAGAGAAGDSIQLEFKKLGYNDVVKAKDKYDWTTVDACLAEIASRRHQAVLRFRDTEPGKKTFVPDYFKKLKGYKETNGKPSDGKSTTFPDWSNQDYEAFILEFYKRLAARYDSDNRLAFLQVGFGLWSEYHDDKGPEILGKTFPSLKFQTDFFNQISTQFQQTPWMISQDAHVSSRTPFASNANLLALKFGLFDDTFHLAWQPSYNLEGWEFFGRKRFQHSPVGGEILFPDQTFADEIAKKWAAEAREFGITFLIGDQWPPWTTMEKIRDHGLACGYKFQVTSFKAKSAHALVTVRNIGVAPIYFDAFVKVDGTRSAESLKDLLPGTEREFHIPLSGKTPKDLTIESDRLVPGQRIEFMAELN